MPRTILRAVALPEKLTPGKLYLSSMPGRNEPLKQFLQEITAAGVGHILCLVSDEEIAEKSPRYLAAIRKNEIPASLSRFAISDFGVPKDAPGLKTLLGQIREKLNKGESVVIHCAAGCGRTGMVAILLLMMMGLPPARARALVERAGSGPETEEQWEFLRRWARANSGDRRASE